MQGIKGAKGLRKGPRASVRVGSLAAGSVAASLAAKPVRQCDDS